MDKRYIKALIGLSLISIVLFTVRAISFNSTKLWFLNWNLFLAWLPIFFGYYLQLQLQKKKLKLWPIIFFSILWLAFLPNSFYLITDFIHLQTSTKASLLIDAVMLFSYSITGLALGYSSVYTVHNVLKKYIPKPGPDGIIAVVFLLNSFAIYLGRYLRWNSWDIIINPAGLLFDVSDRIINPTLYEQTFTTTALFFFYISVTYIVIKQFLDIKKTK